MAQQKKNPQLHRILWLLWIGAGLVSWACAQAHADGGAFIRLGEELSIESQMLPLLPKSDRITIQPDVPLADVKVTPQFFEKLIKLLIDRVTQIKLTGSYPVSAGIGSGRGGAGCFSVQSSVLICVGGDAVPNAKLNSFQAKVGLGAYFRAAIPKTPITVVAGPEVRLSLGLEGLSPQSVTFLEGGVGISAF